MFHFKAKIVRGQGKGWEIGFPTINLQLNSDSSFTLEHGVYACLVNLLDLKDDLVYKGAMHYGARPTLNLSPSLEIHLLDYHGDDLYEQEVEVIVVGNVRGVQKFASVEDLKKQIARDLQKINEILR